MVPTTKYLNSDEYVSYIHNLLCEAQVLQNADPYFVQRMLVFSTVLYFTFSNVDKDPLYCFDCLTKRSLP